MHGTILIDLANLYPRIVDLGQLVELIKDKVGPAIHIIGYGLSNSSGTHRPFQSKIHHLGIEAEFYPHEDQIIVKIAMDAMLLAQSSSYIALVSHRPCFTPMLAYLSTTRKRVVSVGFEGNHLFDVAQKGLVIPDELVKATKPLELHSNSLLNGDASKTGRFASTSRS